MAELTITGDTPAAPAAAPDAAPAPAAAETPAAAPADTPQAKPWEVEWRDRDGTATRIEVPEPYRNQDGTPNVAALAKATSDLRKQLAVPDSYDVAAAIPQDAAEDFADLVDEKAPLRGEFLDGLKQHKFSQAQLNFVLGMAAKREASLREEFGRQTQEATAAAMAEATRVLGSEDKVKGLQSWFATTLGLTKDESASIPPRVLPQLEALRQKLAGPVIPSARDTPPGSQGTSRDDLRKLIADPNYAKDPELQRRVREGYRQLYGDDGDMKGSG